MIIMAKVGNQNLKILSAVFIVFLISFSIFFITLAEFDSIELTNEEISFFENVQKNEKKIYILGSSQVQAINATHIETGITKQIGKHVVYNLAKGSDSPEKRIYSLDLILDSNPTLVLYGIGLRDIQKIPQGGFGSLITQDTHSNIESVLPVPKEIIENNFLEKIGFYQLRLNFLENPKFVLFNQIRELTDDEEILSVEQQTIFQNIPFMKYDEEKLKRVTTKVPESKINTCEKNIIFETHKKEKKISALTEIIKKINNSDSKVVIFTVPQHKNCLDSFEQSTLKEFEKILDKTGKNSNVNVYFLHENYREYDSWYDESHLTFQNSFPYSNDIREIIIQELS